MPSIKQLDGVVAIVTGAARGMGAAFARRLVHEGAAVLLTDILEQEGQEVARELGSRAAYRRHDVTSSQNWDSVVRDAEKTFGYVSVLVNNAAITSIRPFDDVDEVDFRRVIEVNLIGVFLGMKTALSSMRNAGGGSIVNISSVSGIVGTSQSVAYTASKFGVRGMTKAAALDLSQYGIRVNSVHPGFVDTQMIAGVIPAEHTEEFIRGTSPMGRIASPDEIANVVLFLASRESSFITGAEFVVDGGYTAR